jgi:D-beta-D-heptose 7-phosphate kinase / D-beta-D-heptose 1-phosphate adenosyltransferase
VTGAGDTVLASIAIGLALKINIDKIVRFANAAAGIVVGKSGSATVTLDEIEELNRFNNKDSFIDKLLNLKDVSTKTKSLKEDNKFKIVFTNGCFDILHVGHVSYLESAKKLGDILIVGLNSDRSVKVLKGETRPINAELDRAKLLCALSFVDFVIIFDEETPNNLIKQISPNVLVKGGDYKKENIVGLEFSEDAIVLDFVENYSTTKVINKITENEK